MIKSFPIILFLLLSVFLAGTAALAQQPLEVDYPTLPGAPALGPGTTVPEYILYIFIFSLVVVGITALSLFIYAGILWLTASGSTDQIQKAKKIFVNVFLGVILLLGSFLLFRLLNPELLLLRAPDLPSLAIINAPICVPLAPALGQTSCESRGSAFVNCTAEQAAQVNNGKGCNPGEICCRRLPAGELGGFCPEKLAGDTTTLKINQCEDYAAAAVLTLGSQGIEATDKDIANWCNSNTCDIKVDSLSFASPCYFDPQNKTCKTIDRCELYTGRGLSLEDDQKICEQDPLQVGPCVWQQISITFEREPVFACTKS
jgi:hypothetical protein